MCGCGLLMVSCSDPYKFKNRRVFVKLSHFDGRFVYPQFSLVTNPKGYFFKNNRVEKIISGKLIPF